MLNEKIEDTLEIAKELFKRSILNDDEYTQDKLWQIIVNISAFKDQKFEGKRSGSVSTEDDEVKKVQRKIPRWVKNPSQYNSIILNTYMSMSNNNKYPVVLGMLEEATGMGGKQFLTNYTQMKTIAEKNHAKVFTEEDGIVSLWAPVADFIFEVYKKMDKKLFDKNYEMKEK